MEVTFEADFKKSVCERMGSGKLVIIIHKIRVESELPTRANRVMRFFLIYNIPSYCLKSQQYY